MKNPSFSICCNHTPENRKCCCQAGLARALSLLEYGGAVTETNAVEVSLFNVKYGGNFATGQAIISTKLPDNSVSEDAVTVEKNRTRYVVSICTLYGIRFNINPGNEVQGVILANLIANMCDSEDESCCCNGAIATELKKYESAAATGKDVTIEFNDTTNNDQTFRVIKVCNNVALLRFDMPPQPGEEPFVPDHRYLIVPLCVVSSVETAVAAGFEEL